MSVLKVWGQPRSINVQKVPWARPSSANPTPDIEDGTLLRTE